MAEKYIASCGRAVIDLSVPEAEVFLKKQGEEENRSPDEIERSIQRAREMDGIHLQQLQLEHGAVEETLGRLNELGIEVSEGDSQTSICPPICPEAVL